MRARGAAEKWGDIKAKAAGTVIGSVIFFGRKSDKNFTATTVDHLTFTQEKTKTGVTTVRCGSEFQKNGIIIYCPPQAGNVTREQTQKEMASLAKSTNMMVIGFNYKSNPSSQDSLIQDCKDTIQHFNEKNKPNEEKKFDMSNLTIYGRSLGGAVAIHVGAQMHQDDQEHKKPNIISDRSFSKLIYAAKTLPGIRSLFNKEKTHSNRTEKAEGEKSGMFTQANWQMDAQKEAEKIPPGKLTIINAVNQQNLKDDGVLAGRAQMVCELHKDRTFEVTGGEKDLHNVHFAGLLAQDGSNQTVRAEQIIAKAANCQGNKMPTNQGYSTPTNANQNVNDANVKKGWDPAEFHKDYEQQQGKAKKIMIESLEPNQKEQYDKYRKNLPQEPNEPLRTMSQSN